MANFHETASFRDVLDLYDPGGIRGGLSIMQINQLQHGVLLEPLNYRQLEESFRSLLPASEMKSPYFPDQLFCPAFRVLDVLMDLERRRKLTSQIWWDFCSLDTDSDFALTLSQTLTLAKLTLGDKFTENAWKEFLFSKSRGAGLTRSHKFCFEDVRPWLCSGARPTGDSWKSDRLGDAFRQMRDDELEEDVEEFWRLRELGTSKKNKSRLYVDDEEDEGGRKAFSAKDSVMINADNAVETLLLEKYRIIVHYLSLACQKWSESTPKQLDFGFVNDVISGAVFSSSSASGGAESRLDVVDAFKLDFTLLQMVGEEITAHVKRENALLLKGTEYISQGWATHEVDAMLETEYANAWKGKSTVAEMAQDLNWRYREEKKRIASTPDTTANQTVELTNQVCKLREMNIRGLSPVEGLKMALIVTGLTERPQQFPKWGPNFDAARLLDAGRLTLIDRGDAADADAPVEKLALFAKSDFGDGDPFLRKSAELLGHVRARHGAEMKELKTNLVMNDSVVDYDAAKECIYFLRHCFSTAYPHFEANSKKKDAEVDPEYLKLEENPVVQRIISDGVASFLKLKHNVYRFMTSGSADDSYAAVVADLLQRQFHEERQVVAFCLKNAASEPEVARIDRRIGLEKANSASVNNIVHVVLSLTPCDDADSYLFASLRDKFALLRETCLAQMIKNSGKEDVEVTKTLKELKTEEEALRSRADETGLKNLEMRYRDTNQETLSIDTSMGMLHSSIECSLADNAMMAAAENNAATLPFHRVHFLKDLAIRCEKEKESLTLSLYSKRRVQPVLLFDKIRQNALTLRAARMTSTLPEYFGANFDAAALSVGLNDRLCHVAECEGRDPLDRLRMSKLAAILASDVDTGSKDAKTPKKLPKPSSSETADWILHLHDQNHSVERNLLLGILLDPSLSELLELTKEMEANDWLERLRELEMTSDQLERGYGGGGVGVDQKSTLTNDQNQHHLQLREGFFEIFEEAVALRLTTMMMITSSSSSSSSSSKKSGVSPTEATEKLIETLLILQDEEIGDIAAVLWKPANELYSAGKKVEARRYFFTNVRKVLFDLSETEEDRGVVGELSADVGKHYDDSRDRLLLELLKKQLGEKRFKELSEKERQKLLAMLKLKEKQMRKEGRYDEFRKMLQESDALEKMLRDGRSRAASQLKKRLRELKDKRGGKDDGGIDDEAELEATLDALDKITEEEDVVKNVLKYDPSKDAKLVEGLIAGMTLAQWNALSEAERQKRIFEEKLKNILARKNEKRNEAADILKRVMKEGSDLRKLFDASKSKQKAELIARLENAKKKRLAANRDQPSEEELELSSAIDDLDDDDDDDDDDVGENDGESSLKDKLFAESLMAQMSVAEWNKLSEKERQRMIMELKRKEKRLRKEGRVGEANQLLREAFERVNKLSKLTGDQREEQKAKIKERLDAKKKKKKFENDNNLDDMTISELDSVVDTASDVLELLDDKYSALKDKLFDELGKSAMKDLSEAERQRKLMELKKRERQLRQKGLHDEADKMLKEFFGNDDLLLKLTRDQKEEQKAKIKDRLNAKKNKNSDGVDHNGFNDMTMSELDSVVDTASEVVELLDDKYAALKDKLFDELGKSAMKDLSEAERQKKLVELKKRERQLRQKGLHDEADKMLKEFFGNDDLLLKLTRDQREEQKAKIKERLDAKKKKKKNSNDDNHDNDFDDTTMSELDSVVDTASEVLDLLDDKYAALKDKLFDELGKSAMKDLSEAERQKKLVELKKRQRQLRQKGLHDEADKLLREFVGNDDLLKQMAGREKEKRLADLRQRMEEIRRKNKGENSEEENVVKNEISDLTKTEFTDPFSVITKDLETEKAAILGQFLQWQSRDSTEKLRQIQAVKLRLDKKKIAQEQTYETASQIFSMMKRNQSVQEFDSERQRKLARARIAQRQASRTASSQMEMTKVKDVTEFPTADTVKESLLLAVDDRHRDESDALIGFFSQAPASDLHNSSGEKLSHRYRDLSDLRSAWLSQWSDQPMETDSMSEDERQMLREQMDILAEMTGIARALMTSSESAGSDEEDAKVSLLTKLQEIQNAERNRFLTNDAVAEVDLDEERRKLKYPTYVNIAEAVGYYAKSLTRASPEVNDVKKENDEIGEELRKKYDAVKDAMVLEGLMKQAGQSEWSKLTERQRQAKLLQVKMRERRLKQEGKAAEAAALLNKLTSETETAKKMLEKSMNEQKSSARDRIRRKLELKKERQKEGKDISDAVLDVVMDMEEAEKRTENGTTSGGPSVDVMSALQSNFEKEREAIMTSLANKSEQVSSDKARQLEVAKMRIERAKLKREGKYGAAAMVFEKAKLAEKGKSESFTSEQDRQRKLAKDRIAEMKARKKTIAAGTAGTSGTSGTSVQLDQEPVSVQESILRALDEKQSMQSDYLAELVNGVDATKLSEIIEKEPDLKDLKDSLLSFSKTYEDWKHHRRDDEKELAEILKSATLRKVSELMKIDGASASLSASLRSALATLNASLKDKQAKEQRTLERVMVQNDVDDEQLLEFYRKNNTRDNWKEDVAAVILTPDPVNSVATAGNESLVKELNEEMEKQKNRLNVDQTDYDSEMKKLEAQYAAKRRAMQSAFSRQRGAALEKLAAKKAAKEKKNDDADAAAAMLAALKAEQKRVFEQQQSGKEKQKSLMAERLAARKKARELERIEKARKKEEENDAEKQQEMEAEVESKENTNVSDEPTAGNKVAPEAAPEVVPTDGPTLPEVPPPGNELVDILKLEKEDSFASVASADYSITSDDGAGVGVKPKKRKSALKREDSAVDEAAILSKLEREQSTIQMRTIKEIQHSKQKLNQRLEKLKREREKKGELRDKAKEILGMGERQKTMLETMREEERQRATTTVRERIEKVKTERTKTMKERRDNNAAQFKEMVDPAALEGLTEPEKMTKIAQILQDKMLEQERELREGKRKIMVPEADDVMITTTVVTPPSSADTVTSGRGESGEETSGLLAALPRDQDLNETIRSRSSSPRRFLQQEDRMKLLNYRRMRKKEERRDKSAERSEDGGDEDEG